MAMATTTRFQQHQDDDSTIQRNQSIGTILGMNATSGEDIRMQRLFRGKEM